MGKTAAEEIKEMAEKGNPSRIPVFAKVVTEQAYGEGCYDGEEFTLRLARLKERSRKKPGMAVESSVFGAGFLKRLYGKMAGTVLAPVFDGQSMYNMEAAGCMWEMKAHMEQMNRQLENRILQLEGEKEELEKRLLRLENYIRSREYESSAAVTVSGTGGCNR